jgi:pyruvate dehydrogenase E1 component beta subunit
MALIEYRTALNQAFAEEIERDPNVVLIGEEVAEYDGAYKVTRGLWKKYGDKRVADTPISEGAFIGMGIGASMLGLRPVMELMFWSFATVAWDQIVNNAGQVRYMSGGLINCPIVIRGPANGGTNVGATHSHTPENMLANVPGLKVVSAATAYDAKGLMKTAIRDNDPVMFMENTLLYGREVGSSRRGIPDPARARPTSRRKGTHVSSSRTGGLRSRLLKQQNSCCRARYRCEVIDLAASGRLDEEAILASVRKTHRVCSSMKQTFLRCLCADCCDDPGEVLRRSGCAGAPRYFSGCARNLQPEARAKAAPPPD